ncbi:MAG: S-adenosylmethionine:tRNA ribosyltransferase-isomerase [Thermoplasmata archaeon]|nr:S-adenosylmethionine:tRNA ribosyltransferase-isomerase [Thermoplasmata archaeon]
MRTSALVFERPVDLQATTPAEVRRRGRDDVRLLVSQPDRREVVPFHALVDLLHEGDLLVVNRSATLAASLPAKAEFGPFVLNLSTDYGHGIWLAEPRFGPARSGPLPLPPGAVFTAGGLRASYIAPYPGLPRLGFVRLEGSVREAMDRFGRPIRYGYVPDAFPLSAYQTAFGDRPGSAEMPSAGRPFTDELLVGLRSRGVEVAPVTLHTGVSSLEIDTEDAGTFPLYPEPFEVPAGTVDAVQRSRARGGRVVAVGTTVVRALESAISDGRLRPAVGFTRRYVTPERPPSVADALLTGFHDSKTSHLAMIAAFGGVARWKSDYAAAIEAGLLWHEFGDVHLLFRGA